MKDIQHKRGPLATMPQLQPAEIGMTTDSGDEHLYFGTPGGNVKVPRNVEDLGGAPATHNHPASQVTAGTLAGAVVAQDDTAYTTYKLRNAALLSAVPTSMTNGRVAFVYS